MGILVSCGKKVAVDITIANVDRAVIVEQHDIPGVRMSRKDETIPLTSDPAKLPMARPGVGWSILAGVSFALCRFGISAIFLLQLDPRRFGELSEAVKEVSQTAFPAAFVGAAIAGLTGGVLWRRIRTIKPTIGQIIIIGAFAAFSSYVAIGLFHGVRGLLEGQEKGEMIETAVAWTLMCGIGSAFVTGMIVFPALVGVGTVLSYVQQRLAREDGGRR